MHSEKFARVLRWGLPCVLAATAIPFSALAQQLPPDGPAVPTIKLTGGSPNPPLQEPAPNPPDKQSEWNMELVGHDDLQGR